MGHFYTEDLVILKSSSAQIGQIDRTASDVSTHDPNPSLQYPVPIAKGKSISKPSFKTFLRTGVPPRGTVLVNWITLPWQDDKQPILLNVTELKLIDRSLLAGDVVKQDLASSMSGTVIETSTSCSLVQPSRWPAATSRPIQPGLDDDYHFGNYMLKPEDMVHGVSTQDLKKATEYDQDLFILYHNWLGRVSDTYDEIYVRLSNGSVVVVEDPDELDTHTPEDAPVVGDFVRAKKANLRRGRWIYGKYDPSIDPSGFVADVRPISIEVDWLAGAPNVAQNVPPYELDQDDIQSGHIQAIDRSRLTLGAGHNSNVKVLDLDICAGDTVRFRDISGAAVKYHYERILPNGTPAGQLQRIDRTDSLGFDINVFICANTYTMVKVLWQDNTITTLPGVDVVPFLDMAESGDVWPGDLVAIKTRPEAGQDIVKPTRVGIVQSADAQQRIAKVRWFIDANVSYALNLASIIPGSYTGSLSSIVDDVSLYEVDTIPGFERRLGDLVCLIPPEGFKERLSSRPELSEFVALLSTTSELLKDSPIANTAENISKEWFGEVIDLGLDGLLTVRLLGADVVRDIQAPWEGTLVLASTDMEADGLPDDMDMDYDDDDDYDDDSMSETDGVDMGHSDWDEPSLWLDEQNNLVGAQDEWETDEEIDNTAEESINESVADVRTSPETLPSSAPPEALQPSAPPASTSGSSSFSYSSMLSESASNKLASFAVLDSAVPAFLNTMSPTSEALSGARLRRIQKEHKILRTSLPAGVFVRTWESRLDLLRVLILGPIGTPYEYAPFVIDMFMHQNFPNEPPRAYFHSWTDGSGPVNPNLYEDGKICLSLLGTWPGDDKNESWSTSSTVLQVIVSILGLVLVRDPYYNEAGYDARMGTVEAKIPAALYAERSFLKTRAFIQHALTQGIQGFEEELRQLYVPSPNGESPRLLYRAVKEAMQVVHRSQAEPGMADDERRISAGALIPLKRQIDALMMILEQEDEAAVEELQRLRQQG